MPSRHLTSITEHGGQEPVLQYSPMCTVWALTTYDACDIRCSYCASYAQGPSSPRASADEVRLLLERQLPAVPRDQLICLGAIIDCYAHAEAEHQVTRAALEVLVADDRELVIVTKGTLIERDLDLLGGYDKVSVNMSLPSLDEAVLDDIEPQACSGAERFATIERLHEEGVDVQLHVQPWIPGMSDAQQMVDAADGRFNVWVAPLNVQNPVIARSRWGKTFTQREINEAYVEERQRVGRHPNLTWAKPLWLGDDLLTQQAWSLDPADCALDGAKADAAARIDVGGEPPTDDPVRRPSLVIRSNDAEDPEVVGARDLATTGQILDVLAADQMALWGMARLSAHMRSYDAPYPQRELAAEGPGMLTDLVGMVAIMDGVDLEVSELAADGPVIHARYCIIGDLREPYRGFESGARVSARCVSTSRYDNYGLLLEHWIEGELSEVGLVAH